MIETAKPTIRQNETIRQNRPRQQVASNVVFVGRK
jgi:hypothetical protein